ncbi:hypothetical protein XELAEV_18040724mg [Xenopus laevis]|uniref:Ig-like domain-containing protein n=1 Tax=Xenopus laevis TaxID=8355 RepID=A0A974H965_XENLA|nr:hypothetical protein XELAEV_18040724mg [Xenopus laevis]
MTWCVMPAGTMSLLGLLILLSVMTTENAGAPERAIVSFSPNWIKVFQNESVTMTCNVDSSAQGDLGYSWYKDGTLMSIKQNKFTIVTAQESDGGKYQCKTNKNDLSVAIPLIVTKDYIALKVPIFVFEGDDLYFNCAGYPGYEVGDAELYKGDQSISSSHSGNFHIGRVTMAMNGTYRCYRSVKHNGFYNRESSLSMIIPVNELFPKPKISINSDSTSEINEGDPLMIKCDTKLNPHRATTELQFVFYRNGHNVQGFSLSNQYGVPSAQLEHSGNYTCEIKAQSGSVKKKSDPKSIQIKELFQKPKISINSDSTSQIIEGDPLMIKCDTKLNPHRETTELQFAFYRNGHNVQGFSLSKQYGVPSAQLKHSGKYTCEIKAQSGSVKKESDPKSIQIKAQKLSGVSVSLEPTGEQVIAGEKLEILCSVEKGMGLLSYSWCKQYNLSCDTKEATVLEQRFVVESVSEDYGGEYQCTVTRADTQDSIQSANISISVQEKSYAVLGIVSTVSFLVLLFVTAIVAFKYRSNICCHSTKSSGGSVTKDQCGTGPRQQADDHYTTLEHMKPSAEQPVHYSRCHSWNRCVQRLLQ